MELQNEFQFAEEFQFQYSAVSWFINSGTGLVLSIIIVRFIPSIEQQKHFTIVKLTIWVWYGIMNRLHAYRCFLTNCLHGKAAELF